MRLITLFLAVTAALAMFALAGDLAPIVNASTGPIPLNCNRACLENVVDQYLSALVAHDPKRLPVSKDAKYTENDQIIELGDGFWKTVEGRGNYTHVFADPEFGQVAYMGTMREAGGPILLSLRLRIELVSPRSKVSISSRAAVARTISQTWTGRISRTICGSNRFLPINECHGRS